MKALSIISILLTIVSMIVAGITIFSGISIMHNDNLQIANDLSTAFIGIGVVQFILSMYFFIFSIFATGRAFKKQ